MIHHSYVVYVLLLSTVTCARLGAVARSWDLVGSTYLVVKYDPVGRCQRRVSVFHSGRGNLSCPALPASLNRSLGNAGTEKKSSRKLRHVWGLTHSSLMDQLCNL